MRPDSGKAARRSTASTSFNATCEPKALESRLIYCCMEIRSSIACGDQIISTAKNPPPGLLVRHTLPAVQLPNPLIHFGKETKALDCVLKSRVVRKGLDCLQNSLFFGHRNAPISCTSLPLNTMQLGSIRATWRSCRLSLLPRILRVQMPRRPVRRRKGARPGKLHLGVQFPVQSLLQLLELGGCRDLLLDQELLVTRDRVP